MSRVENPPRSQNLFVKIKRSTEMALVKASLCDRHMQSSNSLKALSKLELSIPVVRFPTPR